MEHRDPPVHSARNPEIPVNYVTFGKLFALNRTKSQKYCSGKNVNHTYKNKLVCIRFTKLHVIFYSQQTITSNTENRLKTKLSKMAANHNQLF